VCTPHAPLPVERMLFVGGLGPDVTNKDLADHFSQYGQVRFAQIRLDSTTNKSRGFGFVEFCYSSDCRGALKYPKQQIKGKMCDIREYDPSQNAPGNSSNNPPSGPTPRQFFLNATTPKASELVQQNAEYPDAEMNRRFQGMQLAQEDRPVSNGSVDREQQRIIDIQRAQIKSLEECMRNMQELSLAKSDEVDALRRENDHLHNENARLKAILGDPARNGGKENLPRSPNW